MSIFYKKSSLKNSKVDSIIYQKKSDINFYFSKFDKYERELNLINQQKITNECFNSISYNEVYVVGLYELKDIFNHPILNSKIEVDEVINFGLNKNIYLIQIHDFDNDILEKNIYDFINYALSISDRKFCVLPFPMEDIKVIPLFAKAFNVGNIFLPKRYVEFLSNSLDFLVLNDIINTNQIEKQFLFSLKTTYNFENIKNVYPGYLKFLIGLEYDYNIYIVSNLDNFIFQTEVPNNKNFLDYFNSLTEQGKYKNHRCLLIDFLNFLEQVCSQCGSNINIELANNCSISNFFYDNIYLCCDCSSKLNSEEFFISESLNLWLTFNKNLDAMKYLNFQNFYLKEIRYISNNRDIGFSNFGSYFYYRGELFIISNHSKLNQIDVKDKVNHQILKEFNFENYSVFKSNYAGHYTGIKDILSNKIYTGDIVKLKIHNNVLFGIVVSGSYKGYNSKSEFELYEVISNYNFNPGFNFWHALLKDSIEIEVYSNIYLILDNIENINISKIAEESARLNSDFSQNTFTLNGIDIYDSEMLKSIIKPL